MNFKRLKNKIRNFLIILIYFTGLPYLKFLVNKYKGNPLIRVICWHRIESVERFEKKIRFLMNRFNIVSIEDFKKGEKLDIYKINLIISFDDGYDDWIKNIVPVLRKYKIPALFFVSGGPVNEEGSQGEKPPSFSNIQGLTESDVVQLASVEHFVLGGHGLHHKDQSNLRENEFEHEVLENKKILETLTGYEVQYFAFPFGHRENFSEEIFRYYRYVFSMIPGFNRSIFPGKIIHRDSIDIYFSNLLFKSWLYGSYDWYWKIKNHGVLAGEKSA